jgi:hypothetical protein
MIRLLPLATLALLAACGPRTDASGASRSEARQLDQAAASLDANTVDPNGSDAAVNQD